MDPHTREVLAMVGGYEQRVGDFNRSTQARRQPGSTFKPFVYAAAVDTGEFTAASIVNDAPEVYDLWKPRNFEAGEFAGPMRLRHALARSINTVAIRVMYDLGPPVVAEMARWMGIESELPEHLSLALGSGEVTPLELTNAFATFAAGGKVAPPRFVADIAGEPEPPAEMVEAIRPEVAYVMTEMMRSVVTEGTAGRAARLRSYVVGKTGTSNDARDNWFVGMSPSFVVSVWVGFDENLPVGRGATGGRNALPIFISIMEELGQRERLTRFERPPGVVDARIDRESGLLAHDGASDESSYIEVFLAGTVPTERALAPDEVDAASFVLDEYADFSDGGWGFDDGDEGEDEDQGDRGGIFGGGGGDGASPRP
jgi:penicillin-binding protein 1A